MVCLQFDEMGEEGGPPIDVPLWDLEAADPKLFEPDNRFMEALEDLVKTNPDAVASILPSDRQPPPPYPNARPILRWHLSMVRHDSLLVGSGTIDPLCSYLFS